MPTDWPQRVETVLLDAGGVLLDLDFKYVRRLIEPRLDPSTPAVDETELGRLEALARQEVQRQVQAGGRMRDGWRDYFHIILGGVHVPVAEHAKIIDSLWEAHRRFGLWTVAIEGAPQAVTELRRRGFELGVVSNAEGRVAEDLDSAGYEGLFTTVVDSHVVGVEKPDPRIFRIAMERLGAKSETTIYLGDLPAVDVEGAKAAGITPVLVDLHGLYPSVDVRRIVSIRELPALLDGARSSRQNE
jgi:HAD superfamily hydrolase (TIGR01549 family)